MGKPAQCSIRSQRFSAAAAGESLTPGVGLVACAKETAKERKATAPTIRRSDFFVDTVSSAK